MQTFLDINAFLFIDQLIYKCVIHTSENEYQLVIHLHEVFYRASIIRTYGFIFSIYFLLPESNPMTIQLLSQPSLYSKKSSDFRRQNSSKLIYFFRILI